VRFSCAASAIIERRMQKKTVGIVLRLVGTAFLILYGKIHWQRHKRWTGGFSFWSTYFLWILPDYRQEING
jgi:hypothetical protein